MVVDRRFRSDLKCYRSQSAGRPTGASLTVAGRYSSKSKQYLWTLFWFSQYNHLSLNTTNSLFANAYYLLQSDILVCQ